MRKQGRDEAAVRLALLAKRLAAWRKGRAKGERIPAWLWQLAAQRAAEEGVSRTANVLKLDYYSLQKHLDQRARESASTSSPRAAAAAPTAFVEFPAAPPSGNECVIEFADARGASLRVQWKGTEMPDLRALGRDFWNAQ